MGVTTLVVRDREWLNDQMAEDTRDWVAQDKDGNVWYFGEAVDNYEDGKLVDHDGSWEAGVDGALPGIVMLSNPKAGDTYRQEYYPGKAEDMGTVVAVGKKVTVPQGAFEDCVQIRDWSRIKERRGRAQILLRRGRTAGSRGKGDGATRACDPLGEVARERRTQKYVRLNQTRRADVRDRHRRGWLATCCARSSTERPRAQGLAEDRRLDISEEPRTAHAPRSRSAGARSG